MSTVRRGKIKRKWKQMERNKRSARLIGSGKRSGMKRRRRRAKKEIGMR